MTDDSAQAAAARSEAWQRLQSLNQRLLAGRSATRVLEQWCSAGGKASSIQAGKQSVSARALPPALQAGLALGAGDRVEYRCVALRCDGVTVSEAENWYVPGRLEAAMQQALAHSDRPFGTVVQALGFDRETLSVDWLWRLDEDAQSPPPWALLRHQAILRRADGRPFSAVIETYTRAVLAWAGAD